MPAPARVPLAGSSTLQRKWFLDVNTGTAGAPVWVGVHGITDFKNPQEGNMEDDSDYDSDGWESSTKTSEKWSVELKLRRAPGAATPTAYDPGQEFLRLKSIGQMGPANSAIIRYYEMTPAGPRAEAYSGTVAVQWSPDGGPMKATSTVQVTLTGQGKLTPITHPDA